MESTCVSKTQFEVKNTRSKYFNVLRYSTLVTVLSYLLLLYITLLLHRPSISPGPGPRGPGPGGTHLYRTGGNRQSRGSHALIRSHSPHFSGHETKQQTTGNRAEGAAGGPAVVRGLGLVRACRCRTPRRRVGSRGRCWVTQRHVGTKVQLVRFNGGGGSRLVPGPKSPSGEPAEEETSGTKSEKVEARGSWAVNHGRSGPELVAETR